MNDQTLRELLEKYVLETINPAEAELLSGLLQQPGRRQEVEAFIDSYFQGNDYPELENPALRDEIQGRLRASIHQAPPAGRVINLQKRWIWAAASVAMILFAGGWYLSRKSDAHRQQADVAQQIPNDIAPGRNKAVLTLSDGRKVELDGAADGVLTRQGSAKVVKLGNGQLAYHLSDAPANETTYNTLSTPAGGQFQLLLPDGTKVWLDASSSITYPTSFTGAGRSVQITGQAYLEVAKNDRQPFFVRKGKMEIQVLGTSFNINAYDDETTINTTLVEGAVKVLAGNDGILLRPGQQALLDKEGRVSLSEKVDMAAVLAWKAGKFEFRGADIHTVMRQVARWYDVSVQFEGGEVRQTIYGTIPRSVSAASMFKVLEEAGGIHFKIEGKKVVVTP